MAAASVAAAAEKGTSAAAAAAVTSTYSVGQAIDQMGFGRFQVKAQILKAYLKSLVYLIINFYFEQRQLTKMITAN